MHANPAMLLLSTLVAYVLASSLPSKETCLLQQASSSQRLSHGVIDEAVSLPPASVRAKTAPKSLPMMMPGRRTAALFQRQPPLQPKRAPKSGAKTEDSDPAPVPISTPMSDIKDDASTSLRVELHLAAGLESINESFESVAKFADTVRAELLADMGGLDPRRLVVLGVRGKYLSSVPDPASSPGNRREIGTQVDFEVLPGTPEEPHPSRLIGGLAKNVHDVTGPLMSGVLKNVVAGAAMIVLPGTKESNPLEHDLRPKPLLHKHHDERDAHTEWMPWEWFRFMWKGGSHKTSMSFAPIVCAFLASQVL